MIRKQLILLTLQIAYLNEQLAKQEDSNAALSKAKNKIEQENETLKRTVSELGATYKRLDQDKRVKDHQLRSLQVHLFHIFLYVTFRAFFSLRSYEM